MIAQSNYIII